jgi:hypothetical protein
MMGQILGKSEEHRAFFWAVLFAVVAMAIRIALMKFGLAQSNGIDLKIYRSAGALFNAGINPFDADQVNGAAAQAIRIDPQYFDAWTSEPSRFHYYVSSNPPFSVLFWALLEFLGRGTALFHQLVYSSFDVVTYCLALLLHRQITSKLRLVDVVGISLVTIFNPLVIWWGTWQPEEKQVQTALVLGLLLLMSRPRFAVTGVVTGLVVLYKAVGLPLALAVAFHVALKKDLRAFLKFVAGGLVPVIASFVFFENKFIEPLLTRLMDQSSQVPIHDSMWVIAPSLVSLRYLLAFFVLLAGVLFSYNNLRSGQRIQFCAVWISVPLVMILTLGGSWDRQLMALIPTYLMLYALRPRLRVLLLIQVTAISWYYFWSIRLCYYFGLTPSPLNPGPLVSFLSLTAVLLTLLFDLIFTVLKKRTQMNSSPMVSAV